MPTFVVANKISNNIQNFKIMATFSNDNFVKTNKMVTITFSGWDGKSYNGESCNLRVYAHPQHPEKKFVRTEKSVHGNRVRVYHILTGENHKVSGVPTVRMFTFFDAD